MISRYRLAAISVLLLAGLLGSGCGENEPATRANPAGSSVSTPVLLPTPTAAQPLATVDPLRPPTPMVFPSPTPAGGPSDLHGAPAGTIAEAGEPSDGAAGPERAATNAIKTVTLPLDLTAGERLALGQTATAEGDFLRAIAAFQAAIDDPDGLSADEIAAARLGLAVALLEEGNAAEAVPVLEELSQNPAGAAGGSRDGSAVMPPVLNDIAAFHLGRARTALGDHAGAVEAYTAYWQANPDMAAYVGPLIADAHLALGDTPAAIAALEIAVEGLAQRFKVVENRLRLAGFYMAQGDTVAAIAQYDAVRDIARTEATKGQMTFLAGQAELQAGNTDAAYQRFLSGIENYPRAAETHQGLVVLVNADVPVDDYQRGLVNFYAGSYAPGIEAFRRHIAAEPETYRKDSHVFLAQSYEALGDLENALAELDAYAEHEPAAALLERAALLARAGDAPAAIATYEAFLANHAEDSRAAEALWALAQLADGQAAEDAAGRYLALADAFPFDPNTPRALYRASELNQDQDDRIALWQRLGEQYPANEYGAEALFRLWQVAEADENSGVDVAALRERIEALSPTNYFALRVKDLVAGAAPFVASGPMSLPEDDNEGREAAETWLRERLAGGEADLPPGSLATLTGPLAVDPQRTVGEKLWQLGLLEAAKAELETVRETYAGDPLANYQMAVYFRDLGLFRSSIIAASALLRQLEANIYDAPLFLGRLSFPAYYADLILPLAGQYGFDPRVQFALVRQESLFESFARSGAAAQGLSQVIPDTGAWIAQRLAWPDYVNEDLYKPYVGLNFGAYYLSEQLRGFDNQVHAALAAYNAGPGNAARWFQAAGSDLDRFVDTINFPETRLYIERIYEGFNAYRFLYGRPN